ncbi:hypothetical protein B0H66DRAFT_634714 [Apodospora peruviana]|uniref:Uncharacterized protein n=1 Tax=Apodospora peruviana TaxID=516989 RepID=A0AAE0MEK0_9PEZI|nr:hypothetical protein B0H66DRAFT_634714 [Apodospora peruviana]
MRTSAIIQVCMAGSVFAFPQVEQRQVSVTVSAPSALASAGSNANATTAGSNAIAAAGRMVMMGSKSNTMHMVMLNMVEYKIMSETLTALKADYNNYVAAFEGYSSKPEAAGSLDAAEAAIDLDEMTDDLATPLASFRANLYDGISRMAQRRPHYGEGYESSDSSESSSLGESYSSLSVLIGLVADITITLAGGTVIDITLSVFLVALEKNYGVTGLESTDPLTTIL